MQKSYTSQSKFGRRNSSFGGHNSRPESSYFIGQRSRRPNFSRNPRRARFTEKIDINAFIQKSAKNEPETIYEIKNTFDDMALCAAIKTNLKKRNYSSPTPIQDQAIGQILEGKDLIGLANTGTGKTAAFLLPLINKVYADRSKRVLIIAPTRELAQQIEQEFRQFSWDMKIFSVSCVGGMPIFKQINNLKRNPNFVIGTPGRLKDLSERGVIKFNTFSYIVLDEVDRMMDMGFIDEIRNILNQLPEERQSLFFSATMPPKIKELATKFLKNPVTVEIKQGKTAKNVEQDVVRIRDKSMKFYELTQLLDQEEFKKALIFSETKAEVDRLTTDLLGKGFKAKSIHGDKKQRERQKALMQFRENSINILVATDVAARGLDIKDVSHVINYTVPQTYDDYIHRIGRTGRGDKKGKALTFVEV